MRISSLPRVPSLLAALALASLAACRAPAPLAPEAAASAESGDAIVLCGQRFPIGAPVVLWSDPDGYDAYDTSARDGVLPELADSATGRRYTPGRVTRDEERKVLVEPDSSDLARLGEVVDLFVLHYDVCGVSSRCFEVLQHRRGLSVQFMLDVDGTIYQTLDGRETAWHAAKANLRSIGVELAQIGAWPPAQRAEVEKWYGRDERGTYVALPPKLAATVRTPDFVGRPAREGLFEGRIHGQPLVQYDFTDEQYDSLARLLAVLCRELPRMRPDAPRDAGGNVRSDVLSAAEYDAFSGILAHWHLTERKVDPGPAFDWERLLRDLRAYMQMEAGAPRP